MKRHPAWFAFGLLVFVVLGCKMGNVKNANERSNSNSATTRTDVYVKEMHMAKDDNGKPGAETESYKPSDRTIHCVATLNDPKDGTRVKFGWWVVDPDGAKKIRELDYITKGQENIVHGHLTKPNDWPPGKYKCEVSINGTLDKTTEYTVE